MSPKFIAEPPLPVQLGSFGRVMKYVRQMFHNICLIMWQVLLPFKARPEEIDPFPELTTEVTKSQLEQCQWIFDQAAERRDHLEQKAQSTFGLMVFLVPLIASLSVFLIRGTASGVMSHSMSRA